MKMSIFWHEECLKNMISNAEKKEEQLKRMSDDLLRTRDEISFLEQQIKEAKKKHKDGFDNERFLRKGKKL